MSRQAVERLIQLRAEKRQKVLLGLDRLCHYPHQMEGESLVTPSGRRLSVVIIDGLILTLFVDEPEQRIEVLALE